MAESKKILNLQEELERLRRENLKKDVIINSTHDGMIAIDSDYRVELYNQAAEKILQIPRQEVLNRHVRDVIPNTRLHIILESGRAELQKTQEVGDITIVTNRVPVRDQNGEIIGAAAVFRDKTEVVELAEEITDLKEVRSMLKAIINSTQDAISVVDSDGQGILINPAYTRLTGLTEEDVIGKPADVDIAEGESMHYQVLETEEPVRGERLKVGPQKKEVIVDVAPIKVDGELKGSVGVIHDVSQIKRLTRELDEAKRKLRELQARYSFEDIVGSSDTMRAVINRAKKASRTPATVLLRGESGTGKELFAHAIHNRSDRGDYKFVRVNCNSLADNLLESELFGYEEGAFTGAKEGGKKGLFEEADGGTIFLDEIGKISKNLQIKLLRVLQEKEIIRVGGTHPLNVDVRMIMATNVNLERAVQKGEFREDLYYRLNVFPLTIPPLRERKEDIPPLVHNIIRKFNQEYGRAVEDCTSEVIEKLTEYHWPGNVRELENVIGQAMIHMQMEEEIIRPEHLPGLEIRDQPPEAATDRIPSSLEDRSLKEIMDETEKNLIIEALNSTEGSRKKAAEKLGISVRSLYYKMDKYGID
ncbi:sigma-54 interaction domain-containing protein [Halarsenatibacter silvermanii]|uniref:PAS domain S-box-containing protein n=1 Tax=Halarsenatibacter silvermanii TaxID=321763 RepID=A0A1G9PK43_9FIRM|nr:sigma-54-dependent Fis family transcriptional regulator [Halarsenatibacter silvermanii]SDL99170.1 PAS domain S-box-containing protein [Halarsenatibacter silvermanii]